MTMNKLPDYNLWWTYVVKVMYGKGCKVDCSECYAPIRVECVTMRMMYRALNKLGWTP